MIRCQKCVSLATVHLTEVITRKDGTRVPKEIHLCLAHAVEAGIVPPHPGMPPNPHANVEPVSKKSSAPTSIVPVDPAAKGMILARKDAITPTETHSCPTCGLTWHQFRQSGLMGCPHDYEFYQTKLLPLLKRAQEGSSQHAGKVPVALRHTEPAREAATLRLRRELDRALANENYEHAASIRDQLKQLGSN